MSAAFGTNEHAIQQTPTENLNITVFVTHMCFVAHRICALDFRLNNYDNKQTKHYNS